MRAGVCGGAFGWVQLGIASASQLHTLAACTLIMPCAAIPQTCSEHTDQVWGVRYRPDGARLATTSDDHSVCIFDFAA